MALERIDQAPKEIKFGGEGKAESIKRGFAITTLRNPKAVYDFAQGESILADCFDDGEKVRIVVLSNETKKLKDFSELQLALDGFSSVPDVIEGMKTYPGYENISEDSSIQAITFVLGDVFDLLSKELENPIRNRSFDELVEDPDLEEIFYPLGYN